MRGLPASGGIAIAPVRLFKKTKIDVIKEGKGRIEESSLFDTALAASTAELGALYESAKSGPGASRAAVFKAHIGFIEDAALVDAVCEGISRGESAAFAWTQA